MKNLCLILIILISVSALTSRLKHKTKKDTPQSSNTNQANSSNSSTSNQNQNNPMQNANQNQSANLNPNSPNANQGGSSAIDNSNPSLDSDLKVKWAILFGNTDRSPSDCQSFKSNPLENKDELKTSKNQLPYSKPNPYELMNHGYGQSAYLFDFLQPLFRNDLVKLFQQYYDEIRSLPQDPNYKDPYALENIYKILTLSDSPTKPDPTKSPAQTQGQDNQKNQQPNLPTPQEMLRVWKILNSKLDIDEYNGGITAPMIKAACNQYNWECKASSIDDYSKNIIDQFDYNGDGRLNIREFILATIKVTKESSIVKACKKNCYLEIVQEKLIPMFKFFDCQNIGYINADQVWQGLRDVKRPSKQYDLYSKCDADTGSYRTAAINDFIIKNMKKQDGALEIGEWIEGVLLGFWARQTDNLKIYADESRNLINGRWKNDGMVDLVCEQINKFVEVNKSKRSYVNPFSS